MSIVAELQLPPPPQVRIDSDHGDLPPPRPEGPGPALGRRSMTVPSVSVSVVRVRCPCCHARPGLGGCRSMRDLTPTPTLTLWVGTAVRDKNSGFGIPRVTSAGASTTCKQVECVSGRPVDVHLPLTLATALQSSPHRRTHRASAIVADPRIKNQESRAGAAAPATPAQRHAVMPVNCTCAYHGNGPGHGS